jgi:hypothetical protein
MPREEGKYMTGRNQWGIWAGLFLILFGVALLAGQWLRFNAMAYIWPLFIVAGGSLFFIGMFQGGKPAGPLAIPGTVIITIGLILFFQNLLGIWATWTYAWALLIVGAGLGMVIAGRYGSIPELFKIGQVIMTIGFALFFVFGLFFELGASLLGLGSPGGIIWPVLLILAGLYVLFGRGLMNRWAGPVVREERPFESAYRPPAQENWQGRPVEGAFVAAQEPVQPGPFQSPMPEDASGEQILQQAVPIAGGIRRVRFHAIGDLTILQGDREGLEIEARESIKERIITEMNGDQLEIRIRQDWQDWMNPGNWNMGSIRFTLYVRELETLDAAGLGSVVVPDLTTSHLVIEHGGAGSVSIRRLAADEVSVRLAGLGNIDLEGWAKRQSIELTGAGSYRAGYMESRDARVQLKGLGSATVWAVESLEARVSGAGSVEYYGNPRVDQHVSGVGSIKRLGDR